MASPYPGALVFSVETNAVKFWSAGRQGMLPASSVLGIAKATAAVPIPFGGAPLEGLVLQDGEWLPQVDWGAHWGGSVAAGAYRIKVRTARGPVGLRVDAVTLARQEDAEAEPALPAMEALVAPWAEGAAGTAVAADQHPEPQLPLMLVTAGGHTLAIHAAEVLRVERPQGVWSLRGGAAGECRVALADGPLAGESLGRWLAPAADPGPESWALLVAGIEGPLALLVSAIEGLTTVSSRQLRRIRQRSGAWSDWLLDPERGSIELLDLAQWRGGAHGEVPAPAAGHRLPAAAAALAAERRRGLEARRGLAVTAGPFSCVLPATRVGRVLEGLHGAQLGSRRRRGSRPLLDLGLLLGLEPISLDQGRALWLVREGRAPLALLADAATIVAADLAWQPLPAVPAAARAFFSAIAWDADRCHLQVSEALFQPQPGGLVRDRVRDALRGWLACDPDPQSCA
jgi:chemotaxis signal transduction protein